MDNLILLDCDGVILDFNRMFLSYANAVFHTDFKYEDITDFNYRKCLGEDVGEYFLETLWLNPTLYDGYCFAPEVIDGIAELRRLARVVVVSSTFAEHATSKMQFLLRNGIPWSDIILVHDKRLVERMAPTALMIDDGPHNLDVHEGPKIVVDRPWNQSWDDLAADNAIRAWSWPEIVSAAKFFFTQ